MFIFKERTRAEKAASTRKAVGETERIRKTKGRTETENDGTKRGDID